MEELEKLISLVDEIELIDLPTLKHDVCVAIQMSRSRGLRKTVKWQCDLLLSLKHIKIYTFTCPEPGKRSEEVYLTAKCHFDDREYDSVAHMTADSQDDRVIFLHFYSRFLAGEKRILESIGDSNPSLNADDSKALHEIANELKSIVSTKHDGYLHYLYGVILRRLSLLKEATKHFHTAITLTPLNWAAWLELSTLIGVGDLSQPDVIKNLTGLFECHALMFSFFLGHLLLSCLLEDAALRVYEKIQNLTGDVINTYVQSQIAIAFHSKRSVSKAIDAFATLQTLDLYRLDHVDVYSNLLYIIQDNTSLANLAHHVTVVDKYRAESCCVIANYYSLKNDHDKSILYFQRALKLDAQFSSAWTLLGHEYMEKNNTNAAIYSYRTAVELNAKDHRAWHGLGQAYEVLKMSTFCAYYFLRAQQLRPNDTMMLMSLGGAYDRSNKTEHAMKCYEKAVDLGGNMKDLGLRLGKQLLRGNKIESAVRAYEMYCAQHDDNECSNEVHMFLANYYKEKDYETSRKYAMKFVLNNKDDPMAVKTWSGDAVVTDVV